MKLRIVVVGRDKNDPIVEAAGDYVRRLGRYYPTEAIEVKEAPLKKGTPVARVQRLEAERIEKVLAPGRVIALDERGKMMTSEELARRIDGFATGGIPAVHFVVGGPSGLDAEFLSKRADERWALSKMTLPHRVARLILCEQLYRAATILRGEPYHK